MKRLLVLFKPQVKQGSWRSLELGALEVRAILRHNLHGLPFRKPPSGAVAIPHLSG